MNYPQPDKLSTKLALTSGPLFRYVPENKGVSLNINVYGSKFVRGLWEDTFTGVDGKHVNGFDEKSNPKWKTWVLFAVIFCVGIFLGPTILRILKRR